MKVLAKYDFTKFQPPNWTPTFIEVFGENNEGVEIKAKGITEAKKIMREKYRFNPHFVTFEVTENKTGRSNGVSKVDASHLLHKRYDTISDTYKKDARRFVLGKVLNITNNMILVKGACYAD